VTAKILKAAPTTVRLATPRDVIMACAALATIGAPQARPGAAAAANFLSNPYAN
jgi:hypothetical protein